MNTYKYISPAAAALLALGLALSSCSKVKEEEAADKPVKVTTDVGESIVTFQLNVPVSEDTKTALGSKSGSSYPVTWSSGDQNRISLNGTAPIASNKDSDTQITATFKPGSLSVYNFLYRGDDGHDNQVTIPADQTYYANDFDDAAMPMYAASATRPSANNGRVTFSHLCALLRFSITGSKKIDSITLTPVDGSKSLSGTFTIGKNGAGLLNGTLTPATGGGAVNLNFGSHIQLSNTPFVFYVAIPAGTYAGGLDVQILDNNQGHMNFKVLRDNHTITAGKVRELGTFAYEQVKDPTLKQIWNAATFEEFVTAVANGEKNLNARLTPSAASIDLSGISFNSIDDYQGTFDGASKTLTGLTKPMFNDLKGVVKNLTLESTISITDADDYNLGIFARNVVPSAEIDDIAGLQNCTAKGSITYTPSSALSANPSIGGMVGNNLGGAFINCTNEATVTLADNAGVTHTGDRQPSVGGVVGRSQKGGDLNTQGNISSCTNSGTVSCAEQFGGNIMIGGVIGYGVESGESISGCTNSGLVKATSTCTTEKALHIGGVAGMFKGTIESCSNLTAGTVTTESGSAAGTYLCQGGVFGRLNNTSQSYAGLTNAGTVNVAATGGSTLRLVGGVVGRCNEGAKLAECSNSGSINYTASDANKTYIGGVVASNTTSGNTLEGCQSTGGTLTYSGATTNSDLSVGGVVGYCNKSISNCSNAMTISVTGTMARDNNNYLCFGGVAGYVTGANVIVTNCTNSGAINYGQTVTGNGQTYVGGLVGAVTKSEISGGGNSGPLTFSGQNKARGCSIGGVVGRVFSNDTESGYALSNNVTNNGAIVINSSESGSQYSYVGGLVGQHLEGNIYGTNSGSITVTEFYAAVAALGGLVGYMPGGAIVSGSANTATGDITLNGWHPTYHSYVGGIAGLLGTAVNPFAAGGGTITGASNAGDITFGSGCSVTRNNFIGGVAGYAGNTVSSSSNSGAITNNYSQTAAANGGEASIKDLCIGGVAGASEAALTSCYNTGNVTNNGSTYNVEINVGGVVGYCKGNLTSCSNGTSTLAGGTITNTAKSGTSGIKDLQVGGVAANNRGYTVSACFNKGTITNSGAGNRISIGGVAAWSNDNSSYTSACYNAGTISNSGLGSHSSTGVCMGGIVGYASGLNTLSGTISSYNYNEGDITESSESSKPSIGGICGYANNSSTDFSYCRNLSNSEIEIKNNSREIVCVGGIIGFADAALTIDYSSNAGAITFTKLDVTSSLRAGGILGAWGDSTEQTIEGCENSGSMTADNTAADSKANSTVTQNLTNSAASDTRTYIGGIVGGPNKENKIYKNCNFSGSIRIYCQHCTWLGGIAGYNNKAPVSCTNTGTIRWYKRGGHASTRSAVGGFYGYCSAGSYSGLTYDADINTNNSSPFAYTGGIVGQVAKSVDFSDCKISGRVYGAGTAGTNKCGLFLSMSSGTNTYSFTNCKIEDGTIWHNMTLSTSTTLEKQHLIGGANSSGSTGTINTSGTVSVVASSSF